MNFKLFILFYLLLIETFIELMIKAMDMEILDWMTIDSWKLTKVLIMAGILVYQAFFRWIPFIAIGKFKKDKVENHFSGNISVKNIPWFFFSSIFHVILMLLFGFISYQLNQNAYPLYLILFIGSFEIITYLIVGIKAKLFSLEMGNNSIILSRGFLTIIQISDIKRIEKKYGDEIYFVKSNGKVDTINSSILDKNQMHEFLGKLKTNCEKHNVYFANDLLPH